jgi:leucyl-tRNA synthetase
MPGYDPNQIEKKWQQVWATHKVFAAATDTRKPKYYALDMFPYPSGEGLHVGHPEGYTASDIVARYKRGKGFNVLHPMGWDAFGLPAEQYAIKTNTHPRVTTENNIGKFRKQLQSLGFSYDWDREVDTTDPAYYRWTQWIFLRLYDTWFDEKQQKGRPISELIAEFQSGKRTFSGGPRGRAWSELSTTQQRKILSQYRLAYESEAPVNWCPALGTVLANEEVIDGKSEVGGFPVERKPMKQWMLRITAYAQRLLDGLDGLEWSESLKEMQRNWIGKSDGALVAFAVAGSDESITVFTTRPDTLFGATYMVLAPEHPLVRGAGPNIIPDRWPADVASSWKGGKVMDEPKDALAGYQKWAAARSERERQEDTRKTGVFTGSYAINPVNHERIPIFIADYVLMGYGTGAIMAVPAHDERDHEFATKFNLPIKQVVASKNDSTFNVQQSAFCEEGYAINSAWIEGLPTPQAKAQMTTMLEEKSLGKRQTNYKIRDWLFSRQRYWGEPFPLVHLEDGTTMALAEDQLPVQLPELEDFKPTGTIEPPLSKAPGWVNVHILHTEPSGSAAGRVVPPETPGAVKARRELNTMPQWAGSCWYYLRYSDARNANAFVDPQAENYWMTNGVDLYIGGVEHAVLHLLYSRFWHKVLFDHGLVSTQEPFRKLVNQGLILGEAEYTVFKTESGELVSYEQVDPNLDSRAVDGKVQIISKHKTGGQLLIGHQLEPTDVEKKGEGFVLKSNPEIRVDTRSFKMSKSRGNVVNPTDVIAHYGADSLRLFEMFMGPLEQVKPWSTAGVEGVYRFLQRVWRNLIDEEDRLKVVDAPAEDALLRAMHRMVKKVSEDIERLSFNTAISAMMEFNNTLAKANAVPRSVAEVFVRVLEPFAPHFAEEMHWRMQNAKCKMQNDHGVVSISQTAWPTYDPAMCVDPTLDLPVQINGKLKGRITIDATADEATVFAATLADPEIQKHLAGKEPKKKIYVKGRMVNLVV